MAEEVAMHFNDLLMRIRTFALPFIATAIGAGTALGLDAIPHIEAAWWALEMGCCMTLLSFLTFTVWLLVSRQPNQRLQITYWELVPIALIDISLFAWAIALAIVRPASFLFSAPVLAFGGLLLFSIYLLDRFYYTALLLGAVNRPKR